MQVPLTYTVLSKSPPLASSLTKEHYLDIPPLAVDFACAGDLLPSTATPELGYRHQTPDVLEEKIYNNHATYTLQTKDLSKIKFIPK